MHSPLIAPSLLAADFSQLGEEIRAIEGAGADLLHIDIMDGHFVPNLTMGPALVKAIRRVTKLPFDVHLMVEHPEAMIEPFARAGADWLSVHVEACDPQKLLPAIKNLGCRAGLVINPPTPVEKILSTAELADFILVMTVHPGFAGQEMVKEAIEKIRALKAHRQKKKLAFQIEVDGGVKTDNAKLVIEAGADVVVAGSGIFSTRDYAATIQALRRPA